MLEQFTSHTDCKAFNLNVMEENNFKAVVYHCLLRLSSQHHFSPEIDHFSHLYLIPTTLRPNFRTNTTSVLHQIMAASVHKRQRWANGSHIFLKISIHSSQFKLDFGSISTFVPFESGEHLFSKKISAYFNFQHSVQHFETFQSLT